MAYQVFGASYRIMNIKPFVRLALDKLATNEILRRATGHTSSLPLSRDLLGDWACECAQTSIGTGGRCEGARGCGDMPEAGKAR